jgi:transcriptional regulator with XRE-family HTH domain
MTDDLSTELAATLRSVRLANDLSVNALADRSGVSRAMITKIERGEAQPTAALLGRLTPALGLTLSELFARTEPPGHAKPELQQAAGEAAAPGRISRASAQHTWVDPETGYRRRSVSPPNGPIQLVDVELPAGATVSYPADAFAFVHHQIWVLAGNLLFHEDDRLHDLHPGDCLELGDPVPCAYQNPADQTCRYLVVLTRRPETGSRKGVSMPGSWSATA